MNTKSIIALALVSGLVAGSVALAQTDAGSGDAAAPAKKAKKHGKKGDGCHGKNGCSGKDAKKTAGEPATTPDTKTDVAPDAKSN